MKEYRPLSLRGDKNGGHGMRGSGGICRFTAARRFLRADGAWAFSVGPRAAGTVVRKLRAVSPTRRRVRDVRRRTWRGRSKPMPTGIVGKVLSPPDVIGASVSVQTPWVSLSRSTMGAQCWVPGRDQSKCDQQRLRGGTSPPRALPIFTADRKQSAPASGSNIDHRPVDRSGRLPACPGHGDARPSERCPRSHHHCVHHLDHRPGRRRRTPVHRPGSTPGSS